MLSLLKAKHKKKVLRVFKSGHAFNPNFDTNLLALYDANTIVTDPPGSWVDQSGNNYDITLTNNPTLINNAVWGRDGLQFDGISQYGRSQIVPLVVPFTVYIVFKQIVWGSQNCIFMNGSSGNDCFVLQHNVTPKLCLRGGADLIGDSNFTVGTYNILTSVFNNNNSEIRVNDLTAITGASGFNTGNQDFYLASIRGTALYANIEIAYVIVRNGADDTITQNYFLSFLKTRFHL